MTQVHIPTHWTRDQAEAAIELVESILDALWRQYPNVDDPELNYELPVWFVDGEQLDDDETAPLETESQP